MLGFLTCFVFLFAVAVAPAQKIADASPHTQTFVNVAENVKLEVLDWGGTGRIVVLLAGLGNTAHVFDDFAPKLAAQYHVYGITRRGFGASSTPTSGYDAGHLGEDVLAVFGALKLQKPILIGHSFAGEELSAVASTHPDRIAGLVYLEAGYEYAFDNGKGATPEEKKGLNVLPPPPPPTPADRASLGAYQSLARRMNGITVPDADVLQVWEITPEGSVGKFRMPPAVGKSLMEGTHKYTSIRVPVLAIFAAPHAVGGWLSNNSDPAVKDAVKTYLTQDEALTKKQAKAFEEGVPSSRVVLLKGANHYAFISNEAEVMRAITDFVGDLH